MHDPESEIQVVLSKAGSRLILYQDQPGSLFNIGEQEAAESGESKYQILENHGYGYYFPDARYCLREIPGIVTRSGLKEISGGRITPGIYVGTLQMEVLEKDSEDSVADTFSIEVLPTKLDINEDRLHPDEDYRTSYRTMLEDIAARCSDLLLQINSPVTQSFQPDFNKENETIYQRFAFVKSLVSSGEFNDAVNRILHLPSAKWVEASEITNIIGIRRTDGAIARQIISGNPRIPFELNERIKSVPARVRVTSKRETFDTHENRFIKHALECFARFCEECLEKFNELSESAGNTGYSRAGMEALDIVKTLRNYLDAPLFKEVSRPSSLNLNSPLLQRKGGYREILNSWMLFDLAAKLIWRGGENVYKAGKRDIAILYEYWLFFQLYDLFISRFDVKEIFYNGKQVKNIIDREEIRLLTEDTADGLGLKLRSGFETSLIGTTRNRTRELFARFSYNRTFPGGTQYSGQNDETWIAKAGSWTKPMRPDYTLSFWPLSMEEEDAEREDMIVHIHFDAKYKIKIFNVEKGNNETGHDDEDANGPLDIEKRDERKGIYKNGDLLKMHAYKDAIRRTGGAYVLYPGEGTPKETNPLYYGFHEIIPGLGAFAVRPNAGKSVTGIEKVSEFIDEVIDHFQDRASQREHLASRVHTIHKKKKKPYKEDNITPNITGEPMPEYLDKALKTRLIPDDTFVLVGYYRSQEHYDWITGNHKYNFRTGTDRGSFSINPEVTGASYIVLHGPDETVSSKIFRLGAKGPKIYSKSDLLTKGYPHKPGGDLYLVFEIESDVSGEFGNQLFDIRKLPGYQTARNSSRPFTVSLTEVMSVTVKV
jgi:predicted component of viral defense system (DUF524 family)